MENINKNLIINILIIVIIALSFYIKTKSRINIRDLVLPYGLGDVNVNEFGIVTAEGTWVATNQREGNDFLNDQINTVDIYCHKNTMKCRESRAMLSRLNKKSKYDLFTFNFEYDIKEWTENYINAELSGAGRIFQLNINFNNKKVMLSIKDNPENPTASAYIDTATLENAYNVWDSLRVLNN